MENGNESSINVSIDPSRNGFYSPQEMEDKHIHILRGGGGSGDYSNANKRLCPSVKEHSGRKQNAKKTKHTHTHLASTSYSRTA